MMNKETTKQTNWLVVGLGNPGKEYEDTRHNVGRMAVEMFEESQINQGSPSSSVRVVLPDTYMNLSGGPVAKAMQKAPKDKLSRLIIVHDDIDLPYGEVKMSVGRGSGGQKGVEDIIKALGTKDFIRVRIGIIPVHFGKMRKPKGGDAVARFVLKKFGMLERTKLAEILGRASKAISEVIENGTQSAMNKFN